MIAQKNVFDHGQIYFGLSSKLLGSVFFDTLPYGKTGRAAVAEEFRKMMEIYVNKNSKTLHYKYDVNPKWQKIVADAENYTSDAEFHLDISAFIMSLRDYHTNYYIPAPLGCSRHILPFNFQALDSANLWEPKIVVVASGKEIYGSPAPEDFLSSKNLEDIARVNPGDEVIAINGVSMATYYFDHFQAVTGGANDFGGLNAFINGNSVLVWRMGMMYGPPKGAEDNLNFTFKSLASGLSYEVTIPYVFRARKLCLEPILNSEKGIFADFQDETQPVDYNKRPKAPKPMAMMPPLHEVFSPAENRLSQTPSMELKQVSSILHWGIHKNMGFIRIDSFVPAEGVEACLDTLTSLFTNELKDTETLLLDLRGNGGGYVSMADELPQLFKHSFIPAGARQIIDTKEAARLNKMLEAILGPLFGGENPFYDAIVSGLNKNQTYADLSPFTSFYSANKRGMAWVRAVGILNNAACYSACDMTSSYIQDHAYGTIFGEDVQSGAGGANVVEHQKYLVGLAGPIIETMTNGTIKALFQPLPYWDYNFKNGGVGAPFARISFRQIMRNGKNAGDFVEDDGAFSNYVVRPSLGDLMGGTNQLDIIADALQKIGRESGQSALHFVCPMDLVANANEKLVMSCEIGGYSKVSIIDDKNVVTFTKEFTSLSKQTVSLELQGRVPGVYPFTIVGTDSKNGDILKTNRYLKVFPQPITISGVTKINFETMGAIFHQSPVSDGWQVTKDNELLLAVGVSGQYALNVDTEFYITLPPGDFYATFAGKYNTEADYDYLHISSANGTKTFHGIGSLPEDPLPASKFISIRFTSDGGVNDIGVKISSLTVSPV